MKNASWQTARRFLTYSALGVLLFAFAAPSPAAEGDKKQSLEGSLGWLIGTWSAAASPEAEGVGETKMAFDWAAGEKVILWEGSYASPEANWTFVATFFYDPFKERVRVFSFNSNGQRHLGILTHADSDKLLWRMSGLLPDGRKETFLLELVRGEEDALVLNLKDRKPSDGGEAGQSSVTLRRTSPSGPKA